VAEGRTTIEEVFRNTKDEAMHLHNDGAQNGPQLPGPNHNANFRVHSRLTDRAARRPAHSPPTAAAPRSIWFINRVYRPFR